jgi:hypothetical protein
MKIDVCRELDLAEGSVKVLARTVAAIRVDAKLYGLEADCKRMKASIARQDRRPHNHLPRTWLAV